MLGADLLTEALGYARRGWAVTPDHCVTITGGCSCGDLSCTTPGKHPRIDRESSSAELRRKGSRDPDQIERWWTEWPDSNIAICCGRESNLVVIDIDPRNRGFESLAQLERQKAPLGNTLSVRSGGGGLHLYFAHPGRVDVRNRIGLLPGIDVKADGGRIVAPPSNHKSGSLYRWSEPYQGKQPAPLPGWLLYLIQHVKGTGTRTAMLKWNLGAHV